MLKRQNFDNYPTFHLRLNNNLFTIRKMKSKWPLALTFFLALISAPHIGRVLAYDSSADAANEIAFPKSVAIFDMSEEDLRVTEIIHVLNSTSGMVDLKDAPLIKRLPDSAFNIQYLGHKRVNPEISPGKIAFVHKLHPGEQRLFFSYNLPVSGDSASLTLFFSPGTKKLELISPEKTFDISAESGAGRDYIRAISEKKTSGNYVYDSKTLILEDNREQIDVLIRNVPVSQKKLLYPALAGCALIFLALFWHLKRKT